VFKEPLPRNGLHNPFVILLRASVFLETAVFVAQPFLHGENAPQTEIYALDFNSRGRGWKLIKFSL
jgi:hypothetical protein